MSTWLRVKSVWLFESSRRMSVEVGFFLNVKQLWTIIYRIPKPCKAYSRGFPVRKEDVKRVNVVGVVPVYYRLVVKSKKRRTIRTWLIGYSDRNLPH